jgi:hypothetical protein
MRADDADSPHIDEFVRDWAVLGRDGRRSAQSAEFNPVSPGANNR